MLTKNSELMGKKRRDYIPTDKFELDDWGKHFAITVAKNVNHYGINQEEIKSVETVVTIYGADLDKVKDLIDQKRTQVKKTQKDRTALTKTCRAVAQRIKASSDYTEKVGKEFDIIGAERQIDEDKAKPVLEAQKVPHGWELDFGLDNFFSGVNIYRKRPEEQDFTYLATDTRSPYVDNEPMVNGTKYFAYYILGDTEVGQESDEVTIKV